MIFFSPISNIRLKKIKAHIFSSLLLTFDSLVARCTESAAGWGCLLVVTSASTRSHPLPGGKWKVSRHRASNWLDPWHISFLIHIFACSRALSSGCQSEHTWRGLSTLSWLQGCRAALVLSLSFLCCNRWQQLILPEMNEAFFYHHKAYILHNFI